ncbi:MAG: hypothetical protein ISS16_05890 [Ignavibacteria bacterium]|nr:hypothetical protein [Ignavibacteria bacterium]
MNHKSKNGFKSFIKKYEMIVNYFTDEFIFKTIDNYIPSKEDIWANENPYIINYFKIHFQEENNIYFQCLENMLNYFINNHNYYITQKSVKAKLKSKQEDIFQGEWSKLIFSFYLYKHLKFKVINVGPRFNEILNRFDSKESEDILIEFNKNRFGIEVKCKLPKLVNQNSNSGRLIFMNYFLNDHNIKYLSNAIIKAGMQNEAKIIAVDITYNMDLINLFKNVPNEFLYKNINDINDSLLITEKIVLIFYQNENQQVEMVIKIN